jgi:hypothetical protein
MTTTLSSLTRTIDNAFMHTWYTIREEAMDNILNATVVWAVLNNSGCMKAQVGGEFITRTIRYGEHPAVELERGDTLPQGEHEYETMAIWTWRTLGTHVQRSLWDDQKNAGPDKIKDLVGTKIQAARDGLEQKFETSNHNAHQSGETEKRIQGLNDLVPPFASATTGTYGRIARASAFTGLPNGVQVGSGTNAWWASKYLNGTLANVEDDLLTDMKKLYNSIHNNQSPPNLILTTQELFELYEEYALDISQIIKDESTRLADLGFEVLRFKGKPLVWTPGVAANTMKFLNTDYIEFVYDPNYWFDMTDWKPVPLGTDRIAHIVCFGNMISDQLRRHGELAYA